MVVTLPEPRTDTYVQDRAAFLNFVMPCDADLIHQPFLYHMTMNDIRVARA